ncbi:mechanosensitive ion channel domain-containing protein [Agromyces sp. G08B096]|uniref:Mechanosensitive ion channel domain-containing protein n=1 Tax=Agromyces sp. G08B096 TaxID=3156399 RepID=A0AAU7W776_9MICO
MSDWWTTLDIDAWSIVAVVATLLATWLLARLAAKGARRVVARVPSLEAPVGVLAARITGYAVWLVGVGVALTFLGASVQPILAIALIVAVVLALVLRGIADNFASGVVLQTRHPINVGDEIASGDVVGEVVELNGRSVVVRTVDGRTVHLPNSLVLQEPLTNHSAHGARRSEVQVRVTDASTGDAADLRARLAEATAAAPGVHHRETVAVLPVSRGGGREVLRVQFWHHPTHGAAVSAAVVDALADALAARGVDAVVTSDPPPPALAEPTGV